MTRYATAVVSFDNNDDEPQAVDLFTDRFSTLAEARDAAVEVMRQARADVGGGDFAIQAFIDDPAGGDGWRIDEMNDGTYTLCEFGTFVEVQA